MRKLLPFLLLFSAFLFLLSSSANADLLTNTQRQLCPKFNKKAAAPNTYHLRAIPGKTLFKYSQRKLVYEDNALVRLQDRLCRAVEMEDSKVVALLEKIQAATIDSENITITVYPNRSKIKKTWKVRKRLGAQAGYRWQISFERYGKEGVIPIYQLATSNKLIRIVFNLYKANLTKACSYSNNKVRSISKGYIKLNHKIRNNLPRCEKALKFYYKKNPPWQVIPVR